MDDLFKDLKEKINKNVKGVHVSILSESNITSERYWVKTPAFDLNRILGGSLYKGIQSRNIVAIVGPEHTMKSSFMILCMVNAQKESNCSPVIIDTEGGITKNFCERWGLDPEKTLYIYTPWIHEVKSILAQIKESGGEKYIIGLDSVGGLDRYKSFEDAAGGEPKADQGILQKEIRSTLKLLLNICIIQNSIGILTGHYYGSPGVIPMPDQIGGGKAIKLFPSVIISLKKEHLKEGSNIVGNKITATTLKNRLYPPFQNAQINLDYKNGIKEYAGMLELGTEIGLVEKSGSWYSYKGERLGQGVLNSMENIKNTDLINEIDEYLKTTGYSSIDKNVEEAMKETGEQTEQTEERTEEKNNKKLKKKK
jgi:recombination protein RecA